jgi:hypothetical protein
LHIYITHIIRARHARPVCSATTEESNKKEKNEKRNNFARWLVVFLFRQFL